MRIGKYGNEKERQGLTDLDQGLKPLTICQRRNGRGPYSSGWILNLGVVPLLRFCFFLLAPVFLILLALRVFVTLVLETINQYPFYAPNAAAKIRASYQFKASFLPAKAPLVKIFLCSYLIFFQGLDLYSAPPPRAKEKKPVRMTPSVPTLTQWPASGTLVLGKGEQREIPLPRLEKFSLGNREVVSTQYLPQKGRLLIKGKSLGQTDLLVWSKDGKSRTLKLYIISKQHQLRSLQLLQLLSDLGLSFQWQGPLILVQGTLRSLHHLQLLRKLEEKNPQHLLTNVRLSRSLRNQIVGRIYWDLFQEGIRHVSCKLEAHLPSCTYDESTPPNAKTLHNLQKQYGARFQAAQNSWRQRNYLVKMKIVQMEKLGGEEFQLGLHQLSAPLDEIFGKGLISVISKNEVLLRGQNIQLSTLAEPETILRVGVPATLEMGEQLPITTNSDRPEDRPLVDWKFAGLKIKLLLTFIGRQPHLRYSTEFTRPMDQNIVGNKEASSVVVTLGRPFQLFQIGHKTHGQQTTFFPGLGQIPLLGRIFQSTSAQSSYKKIHGLLLLEEAPEENAVSLTSESFSISPSTGQNHEN